MKSIILTQSFILFISWSIAQENLWLDIPFSSIPETGMQDLYPDDLKTYRLDTNRLLTVLAGAPQERDVSLADSPAQLIVPLPDGSRMTFRIVQYQMMEEGLSQKYPDIFTIRGISLKSPQYTIRADWTYKGFRAYLNTPKGKVFIDPVYRKNRQDYMVYFKKDYTNRSSTFSCHAELEKGQFKEQAEEEQRVVGDCQFRTYRLAMATTGEYSNYHGGNSAADAAIVLAEVVTAVNRVNEVYERDVSVRLLLIADTDDIFYYDGNTDPYTNNSGSTMLGENQSNVDAVIGSANYDIGHVFSTGGGGIASLRSPCNNGSKARGVTGLNNPINDPFYIDYVAHEVGHQFGGNHTQNNSCNRAFPASMEPGSASTIMGYAGICSPNVQSNSDDYFHGYSILEMADFVTNVGTGGSCASILSTSNTAPTATDPGDHTIPISTPFRLSTTGSDVNDASNLLTYCWEQWDPEVGEVMPPTGTNTQGPLFRTFDPTSESTRYFPALSATLNGSDPTWEELASVSRELEFRVSVRDNNSDYGCVGEQNVNITVDENGGPFTVTSQSGATNWTEGQYVLIEWAKGFTNLPPINSPNVNIYLANDGQDFSTVLASSVLNNGKAYVLLPSGTTANARIMVEGDNNVFFNVNGGQISIGASGADYGLGASPAIISSCPNASVEYTIQTSSFSSYSSTINLSTSNIPSGLTVNLGSNMLSPGASTTLTVSGLQNIITGSYSFTVNASSSSGDKAITLYLNRLESPSFITTSSPVDNAIEASIVPTFTWQSDISSTTYDVELATDPAFNNIIASTNTSNSNWVIDFELDPLTTYYWRIRGIGDCGNGPWSASNTFTTVPCIDFISSDVPVAISSGSPATYTSDLNIDDTGVIEDLNVINLSGDHTYVSDLFFTLISPDGTSRTLFGGICGNLNDFDLGFNTQSVNPNANIPCPPTDGNIYQPSQSFDNFNGESINGNWVLSVEDVFNQDGGEISSWGLRLCISNYMSALPVELIDFSVQPREEALLLKWATASELNNKGFWIEKRLASESSFLPIAWVDGQGTTTLEQRYEFLDEDVPRGQNIYYRLRQVDYNGTFDFSPIRQGKLELTAKDILVYPNPTYSELTIELGESPTESQVLLFNAKGQLFIQQQLILKESQLSLTDLPEGIYWLRIQESERTFVQKVIKL